MKAAITDNFVGELTAELAITNSNFSGAGFDPAMVKSLKRLPQVAAVSTLDRSNALIDGEPTDITVVDVPGSNRSRTWVNVRSNPTDRDRHRDGCRNSDWRQVTR